MTPPPGSIATRLARAAGVPLCLVAELRSLHERQWCLEDETRLPGASPEAVATAKAGIDESNARRHRLIDRIDAAAAVGPPTVASAARSYSETVGELCDRLLILDLKHRAMSDTARAGAACGPADGRRRNRVCESITLLCDHLDTLVTQLTADLAMGVAVLPPRLGLKIYKGHVDGERSSWMPVVELNRTFARDFHDAGFGVVRGAVPPDAVDELRLRLRELMPNEAGNDRPLQRFVPRIVERNPRFADLATSRPLVSLLKEIFGVVPQLVCSYGHEKPACTGAHTRPHSDVAHLVGVAHHLSTLMVKAMYALTPVRAWSGGTLVCPGSHRQEPGSPADGAGHYVVLDRGDLFLFHAHIRHTATENTSSDARLSIWLTYALPWMRPFPGYEYGEEFLRDVRRRATMQPDLNAIFGLADPYATSAAAHQS